LFPFLARAGEWLLGAAFFVPFENSPLPALFPFMSRIEAKRTFRELMMKARQRRLTETDKRELTRARQALRHPRKRVSRQKARQILHEGYAGGYPLTKKQRGFFGARARGLPVRGLRSNPRHVIGKVIEICYKRTIGKHAGEYYKHAFRRHPNLSLLPDGSILIKG